MALYWALFAGSVGDSDLLGIRGMNNPNPHPFRLKFKLI